MKGEFGNARLLTIESVAGGEGLACDAERLSESERSAAPAFQPAAPNPDTERTSST